MREALTDSIEKLDGVFTYLISDQNSIGLAKDRYAIKPLATVQDDGTLCAATEAQALRRIFPDEIKIVNYEGPAETASWDSGVQVA